MRFEREAGLRIENSYGHALFSLSQDGTLVSMPGGVVGEQRRLIVVDRAGRISEWSPERAFLEWSVDVAPRGDRAAVMMTTPRGINELWIWERGRSSARRISMPGTDCTGPAWSADDRRIAFVGASAGSSVHVQSLDGDAPRRISRLEPPASYTRLSWSPDGTALLATKLMSYFQRVDVDRIPLPSETDSLSAATPLLASPDWREVRASFSPDGRWIAYESNGTGIAEVYVARYGPGGKVRMPVALRFEPPLSAAAPAPAWDLDRLRVINDGGPCYDLLPGGEIVAIQRYDDEVEATHAEIVLNLFEELRQRVRGPGSR